MQNKNVMNKGEKNETDVSKMNRQSIWELLEERAAQTPDKVAVRDEKSALSWKELYEQSIRAGQELSLYVKRKQPVAIVALKSTRTLVSMMGAVYAGAFYVAIDPSLPTARLASMLDILHPCAVIAGSREEEKLRPLTDGVCPLLPLDAVAGANVGAACPSSAGREPEATCTPAGGDDILYAVFTSGSTGTPKCVAVTHRCVLDFIGHFIDAFDIRPDDVIANQAPFDFDVSVKDIYSALYTGAELVLVPKMLFGFPGRLIDFLCEHKATVLTWAVSALGLVAAMGGLKYKVPKTVRRIMFSGEVMPGKILAQWKEALPEAAFVNLYGPSEITCNCTYFPLPDDFDPMSKMPIGVPFAGRRIRLVDEKGAEVTKSGVEGEICVEGESIAVGYYHNEEETNRRFYTAGSGRRGYRTGDLGYYGADGLLYFSGRKDFQIKHMGHRIELEEVGRCIEQQRGVEQGVCLFDEEKNRLVGFYLGEADEKEVRGSMRDTLPAYMVPHRLIRLDSWPVNKNGKTDRKLLTERMRGSR